MIKRTMTMMAWAAIAASPTFVGAQATTPPTTAPLTCDCPQGDSRGDLRNLAAFAPLGLLGALAAAGGAPALFADKAPAQGAGQTVATATTETPKPVGDPDVAITDRARNATPENTGAAPSMNRGNVPDPVSPDSLRAGLRAPNTGTPLPSVFLLGTGLIAVGCVTVLRTRS